jgi:hypothetical protein
VEPILRYEAMASGALIAANNNEFNVSLLSKDAYYFWTPKNKTPGGRSFTALKKMP